MELNKEEIKKIIAPAGVQVFSDKLKIGERLVKILFFFSYPRYLASGWFDTLINLPSVFDIAIYMNPMDTAQTLKNLRKKAAQVESQLMDVEEKGLVRDPMLETAMSDIEGLRDSLQQAQEKLYSIGVYIAIYAGSEDELAKVENQVVNLMESRLVFLKPALFQQLQGLYSIMPTSQDVLNITTPLNTGPASSFFPFVSENLVSDQGILYGVNRHNNGLIIFDRFQMENPNQVVFATAGSGKSYATKLDIIRSLMMGTEVLIIDPEDEYRRLAEAFGGSVFEISISSQSHINPFDIPIVPEGETPSEVLRSHMVTIAGLIKLMLGNLSAEEDALLDRAITETYASREIVVGEDFSAAQPPLLTDLETVLRNLEGGRAMAERLYKYTQGSFSGFLNQPTNLDIANRLIVFSIRDLEEELRPIAMYVILNFIWNIVKSKRKRRMLIVEEAWIMMKYEDSASFLFGLVKRCRKYYLGITTVTQDVEDFLRSPYGRPIITNSAIQLLLKQAPATIDVVSRAFALTDVERSKLLTAPVGTGIFIAGRRHVEIQIVSSYFEHELVTTNPQELLDIEQGTAPNSA